MNGPLSNQDHSPRERAVREQRRASDPAHSAWVTASAGSGKTKVLTDRVLRLLLQEGQRANRLLCLTFTKAAAAEMQTRLASRLGEWACADDAALGKLLVELTGEAPDRKLLGRARELFAEVLDLAGGMRISTIHAFCQSLLRSFPLEAGLPPHFSVIEEVDTAALLAEARESVLAGGAATLGDGGAALARMAGLVSAEQFAEMLGTVLRKRERLADALADARRLRLRLLSVLGLDEESCDEDYHITRMCQVPESTKAAAAALVSHANKTQRDLGARMLDWLGLNDNEREQKWKEWESCFYTDKSLLRVALVGIAEMEIEAERIRLMVDRIAACRLLIATETLIALAAPVLEQYRTRKDSAGLLSYDDLIAIAQRVLHDPGSAWVLFKLDGGLDHVLLDEAQDTNPAQWKIAGSLTEEFFAGEGAREARGTQEAAPSRTIFAVGDVKQSIYGFQGADPAGFALWRDRFGDEVGRIGQTLDVVPLDVSFRSTEPVLALVDAVLAEKPARDGVVEDGEVLRHLADRVGQAGMVEIWPKLRQGAASKPVPWLVPSSPERAAGAEAQLAEALASRIRHMIDHEVLPARCLDKNNPVPRPIRAGDILILVRRRTRFVQMLVRALKERGVVVGGVDRLHLAEQIAVQDLLALADVMLQPDDDLALAALLKSPLCGVSEEELFALAMASRDSKGSLWAALLRQRGAQSAPGRAADWLAMLADRADLVTPHTLLAEVLGEHGGRKRLLARLGPDASDPLDEILNAALTYERQHPPSLQGFVHWLRRGNAEIKREAESGGDAVRIMTVHGAKGLQAPVVILPDVGTGKGGEALRFLSDNGVDVPVWAPNGRKEFHSTEFKALLAAEQETRRREENRLLYVALTRAEDRLLICGWDKEAGKQADAPAPDAPVAADAKPAKKKAAPKPPKLDESWHALIAAGFARLEGVEERGFDPSDFGAPEGCDFGCEPLRVLVSAQTAPLAADRAVHVGERHALPDWARVKVAEEADENVLRPSLAQAGEAGGEDEVPVAAPHGRSAPGFGGQAAGDPDGRRFRRGTLIHALLQHLPERPEAEREEAARTYLARPGHRLSGEEQALILGETMTLLASPVMRDALGADSLAEAPIAGRIAGRMVSGQVDRLVVRADHVLVLDYKTNRPPPENADAVPRPYLRQMAAYRAVLRAAFPDKAVRSALVWTYGARLMELPDDLLDPHAPGR